MQKLDNDAAIWDNLDGDWNKESMMKDSEVAEVIFRNITIKGLLMWMNYSNAPSWHTVKHNYVYLKFCYEYRYNRY